VNQSVIARKQRFGSADARQFLVSVEQILPSTVGGRLFLGMSLLAALFLPNLVEGVLE